MANLAASLLRISDLAGDGRSRAIVARVLTLRGFGGATRVGETVIIDEAAQQGSILGSGPTAQITKAALAKIASNSRTPEVIALDIGDAEAVRSGLACGGLAHVVLQPIELLPPNLPDLLRSRTPFVLVTHYGDADPQTTLWTDDTISSSTFPPHIREVATRSLERRKVGSQTLEDGEAIFHVEVVASPTHLVIVGEGRLAEALSEVSHFLGWSAMASMDAPEISSAIGELGPLDGLIILSHDHDFVTPLLDAVLKGRSNCYIGSLGSRHTQEIRRDRLMELGYQNEDLASIHGPVGLDLGASTPQETALAIAAELQAYKTGRSGVALRSSVGPING